MRGVSKRLGVEPVARGVDGNCEYIDPTLLVLPCDIMLATDGLVGGVDSGDEEDKLLPPDELDELEDSALLALMVIKHGKSY